MFQVIPKPNGPIQLDAGFFYLPEKIIASVGRFSPWCLHAFSARTNHEIHTGTPWLFLQKDDTLDEEDYLLQVCKDRVRMIM